MRRNTACAYADLYEAFNPMSYQDAVDKEIEVGIDLRSAGFGVWQA